MSTNEKQVGGDHYKGLGEFQHWDVVHALGWDYLVGAATKYLWRLGRKGDTDKQIEDIGKAIHFLEKKREQLVNGKELGAPVVFADLRKGAKHFTPAYRAYRRCEVCKLDVLACICGEATKEYVDQDR